MLFSAHCLGRPIHKTQAVHQPPSSFWGRTMAEKWGLPATIGWLVILLFSLPPHAWADLTGRWTCDDGGTYYLRQHGRQLYWYAESNGVAPVWTTVFCGQISGNRIKGQWADVPKGRTTESGDLVLVIEKDANTFRAIEKNTGYRGSRWSRQASKAIHPRPQKRLQPSGKNECARFDPSAIRVQQIDGQWKIIDKKHWLFDFGPDQAAAHKALKVIRHYRMDRMCALGSSHPPSFSYLLAKGGSPWGPMVGEACVPIDPKRVAVSKFQGRWKITSGKRWLFDFGNRQSEARQALAVIRKHGFTYRCRVGNPGTRFTYLRR